MSRDIAKQFLLSAGSGTKRELDPVLAGAASVATEITYAVSASGIRRFSPESSNGVTATIPAAPATFSGVGWEMDAVVNADPIQFVDSNWLASIDLVITGATTGPAVTYTMIYFVNGAEIGRKGSTHGAGYTGSIITTLALSAAGLDETLRSSANPKIQIELYANVTVTAVSVGTTTHAIRTNDADSWIDPPDPAYNVRATRTIAAGLALTGSKSRKLTLIRSRTATLTFTGSPADVTTRRLRAFAASISLTATRRLTVKPAPKQAGLTLVAVRQPTRVVLNRAATKAVLTLTASKTTRITKRFAATLTLTAGFGRALRLQRRFTATITFTGRFFVTLTQQILARMVSGGTTIIKKIFAISD